MPESSPFERALELMTVAQRSDNGDQIHRTPFVLTVIGGHEHWNPELRRTFLVALDELADIDDSYPEGSDWKYWLTTTDPPLFLSDLDEKLGSQHSPSKLELIRVGAGGEEQEVVWTCGPDLGTIR